MGMNPTIKVSPRGTPAPQEEPEHPAELVKEGKGFIRRCAEIIIQDAKDKLYVERARRRKEYENFIRDYGPKPKSNGGDPVEMWREI
jgi:hypothetical protein